MKRPVKILRKFSVRWIVWIVFNFFQWTLRFLPHMIEGLDKSSFFLHLSVLDNIFLTCLTSILLEGLIIIDELQKLTRNKSAVKVFTTWNDPRIIAQISSARESLTIIDSYFDQAPDLGDWVKTALDQKPKKLDVSIYMVSPECPLGAQRDKERKKVHDDDVDGYANALWEDVTDVDRNAYRASFHTYCKAIMEHDHLCDNRVRLRLYEYPAMPSVRLIVVDERTYFFGWFPLRAHNPPYICFSLSDVGISAADREVVARLKEQADNVRMISKRVFPLEQGVEGTAKAIEN